MWYTGIEQLASGTPLGHFHPLKMRPLRNPEISEPKPLDMQSYYRGMVPSVTPLRKPESLHSLDVDILQHMGQNILKL